MINQGLKKKKKRKHDLQLAVWKATLKVCLLVLLPIGQVSVKMKTYLPDRKIYLPGQLSRPFFEPC